MTRTEILQGLKDVVQTLHDSGEDSSTNKAAFKEWQATSQKVTKAIASLGEEDIKWLDNEYQIWESSRFKDKKREYKKMIEAKETELKTIFEDMDLPIGRTENLTVFNLLWLRRNMPVRNSEVQGFKRANELILELITIKSP